MNINNNYIPQAICFNVYLNILKYIYIWEMSATDGKYISKLSWNKYVENVRIFPAHNGTIHAC